MKLQCRYISNWNPMFLLPDNLLHFRLLQTLSPTTQNVLLSSCFFLSLFMFLSPFENLNQIHNKLDQLYNETNNCQEDTTKSRTHVVRKILAICPHPHFEWVLQTTQFYILATGTLLRVCIRSPEVSLNEA